MLNIITVAGRMCGDPELKTTSSGISVCSFRIACERDFADKQTGKREADFIDVVAWRSTAEFLSRYFNKGDMIIVTGSLQSRKWQDKDGNNRVSWEIQATNLYFGESKRVTAQSEPAPSLEPEPEASGDFTPLPDSGDLPF